MITNKCSDCAKIKTCSKAKPACWIPSVSKTTCRRCGRSLRTKESIDRGYGKECFEKIFFGEKKRKNRLFTLVQEEEKDD